jgi:hypothetical protein
MALIMKKTILGIIGIGIALGSPCAPADEDAKPLLLQGLFAEESEQKLDKAAANYEQIIAAYDSRREYAIADLYRLAEVRRSPPKAETQR